MKIIKRKMSTTITAVAEIDDSEVIVYLEKTGKCFFGLLDWDSRATDFSVFTLSNKTEYSGVLIERMIHGFICRPSLQRVSIDDFNLLSEFENLYNSYMITENRKKEWETRLLAFEDKWPDINTNDTSNIY